MGLIHIARPPARGNDGTAPALPSATWDGWLDGWMDQCRGRLTVGFICPSLSHRIRSSRRRRRRRRRAASPLRYTSPHLTCGRDTYVRVYSRAATPTHPRWQTDWIGWIGTTAYRCSAPVDDRWGQPLEIEGSMLLSALFMLASFLFGTKNGYLTGQKTNYERIRCFGKSCTACVCHKTVLRLASKQGQTWSSFNSHAILDDC